MLWRWRTAETAKMYHMWSKNEQLTHKNVVFLLQDQTSKNLRKRGHCATLSVQGRLKKAGAAATSVASRSALVTCTPSAVTACDICYVAGAKRVCVAGAQLSAYAQINDDQLWKIWRNKWIINKQINTPTPNSFTWIRSTLLCTHAWAQFGGVHGRRVPPAFFDGGT